MIFNGHTHDSIAEIDDVTMANLQTMYADGVIGNHGLIELLSKLTNAIFNYLRPANSSAYSIKAILGGMNDYLYPPLPEEYKKEQANQQLLAFMTQAPGFDPKRFGVD